MSAEFAQVQMVLWSLRLTGDYEDRCAKKVYFIQSGDAGPVKIGVARNPQQRLYELQSANAEHLRLLAVVVGDETVEKWLHRAFAPQRIRGEWFECSGLLLEVLEWAVESRVAA